MTMTTNLTSRELSQKLKKEAFAALDRSKTGRTVRVNYNELIDLCLEFEKHLDQDYSDLEYSLKVVGEENRKLLYILDRIMNHATPDSRVWDLACCQHASYEDIDAINNRKSF